MGAAGLSPHPVLRSWGSSTSLPGATRFRGNVCSLKTSHGCQGPERGQQLWGAAGSGAPGCLLLTVTFCVACIPGKMNLLSV